MEKEKFASFKVVLDDAEKDKHGITLDAEFDFGIVEIPVATKGIVIRGTISITIPSSRITLIEIKLASAKGVISGTSP